MPDPVQIDLRRPRGVRRPVRARLRNVPADQITSLTLVVPSLSLAIALTPDGTGWWSLTPPAELADAAVGAYPFELVLDRGLATEVPVCEGRWEQLRRVS